MIDEKKLIEKIQARRDFWTNKSAKCIEDGNLFKANMCNIMATELNGILCMIDEQPKAGEWIPCSEKLPEPYESVLVTAEMEGGSHPLTYQGARTGCTFELSGVKNLEDYIVTAWQPLPEPWEGE